MNWLVIDGVKPYDGRYEFDLEGREFNTREWGWIKRLSGYLPLTIEKGFEGGDPELFAVFAVICLNRAGTVAAKDVSDVFERISEAPFGSTIRLEDDEPADAETGDAGPPPANSSGKPNSSGTDSKTNSETSPAPPNGSGTPDSDTSAWHPLTSAS